MIDLALLLASFLLLCYVAYLALIVLGSLFANLIDLFNPNAYPPSEAPIKDEFPKFWE